MGPLLLGALASLCAAAPGAASAAVAPSDRWGFEQVTPVDKRGGNVHAVDTFQTSPDGQAFLHSASGSYAGVLTESVPLYTRYLAQRGDTDWFNRGVDVPLDAVPPGAGAIVASVVGTSRNLRFAVVTSTRVLSPGAIAGGSNVYLRDTTTGAYRLIAAHPATSLTAAMTTSLGGGNVKYVSPTGDAVLFTSLVPLVNGAPEGQVVLYRWTAADGIEVVSKLPAGEGSTPAGAITAVGYGSEDGPRQSLPRVNGASTIYFSLAVEQDGGYVAGPAYRWTEGDVSVISQSQIPGDDSPAVVADVMATTSNGDYTLIKTRAANRLTSDAPTFDVGTPEEGTEGVLYRYARASGDLTYVGVADLQTFNTSSVVDQMSEDGRTIVFRTFQQLTPDAAEFFGAYDPRNRQNLYVWRDGVLRFVTSVDPGARSEGGGIPRLLSENGRYLAFVDESQGTASRFGISDNTSAKCGRPGVTEVALCDQVYVFDADQPGSLECASCRPGGARPQGRSGDPTVEQTMMRMNGRQVQIVADDGTVFFSSTEDLTPDDSNGLQDAYAYRSGTLRLVSRGVPGASARFLDATPDGSSVFFATNAQLAETDTDRAVDVYVTRLGGGFPYEQPFVPPPCSGSSCRDGGAGPLPEVLGGGSAATSGRPPARSTSPKPRIRLTRIERRKGSLRVTVRTSEAGRVRASGKQVRPTTRSARRAGDLSFSVPLSKKSRTTVRDKGRLRVKIRVSLSPPFGKSAATTSTRTVR